MSLEPRQASIVIDKLSKRYGRAPVFALKDLSLFVEAGEVYGFLGPNGAGKSTAIRLLMNFIQPTSGRASILGHDMVKDNVRIKQSVGYLSGDFAVYPKMTGEQYLTYMSGLQPATDPQEIVSLTRRLQADLKKPLGALSRGNRQKIGIIQAFMSRPEVLILDEPSSGLDPLMQEVFYELVTEAKERGAAVFVSSHIMGEVQKMCDRVGIIRSGRLVGERVIADMADEAAQTFDITFEGTPPTVLLKKLPGAVSVKVKGQTVSLHMHGELKPLFSLLAKYDVRRIDTRTLDLEEAFMRYYENEGDES